jgi:orotate phosphoribosyltransferase
MNVKVIFDLITTGLSVIEILTAAQKDAGPAIKALTSLVSNAKAGTLTKEQITQTRVVLDRLIETFNEPLADESA